ncbi:MAG: zinc ribbon domain-containing protein [Candidatus Krumholzibacteriota bacterium]|nr:zinc ribbon domain-containing protein [Candidatus Krumholzibacteriota bacterium]
MPIFEYKCCRCEENFEELVLSGSEPVTCPACGSSEVEKQFSAFSSSSGSSSSSKGSGCGSFG